MVFIYLINYYFKPNILDIWTAERTCSLNHTLCTNKFRHQFGAWGTEFRSISENTQVYISFADLFCVFPWKLTIANVYGPNICSFHERRAEGEFFKDS